MLSDLGTQCIQTFKYGTEEHDEYHFVWNKEFWSLYIPQTTFMRHQTTKPLTFTSLKRKRATENINHIRIQKTTFDCGVSQFDYKASITAEINSPLDSLNDPQTTPQALALAQTFMLQFDMIPNEKEFEIVNEELPRLHRGIIAYVPRNANVESIRYAFCHVLKRSMNRNQVFIVDNIPNIEVANWCRDFFIQEVYGDYSINVNDENSMIANVPQNIKDASYTTTNEAIKLLSSKSKTYYRSHTRARFLSMSKEGPTCACHICSQLFFKDMMK